MHGTPRSAVLRAHVVGGPDIPIPDGTDICNDDYTVDSTELGTQTGTPPQDCLTVARPVLTITKTGPLTATVGQVYILPRDRVRELETTLGSVVNSVTQWGVGTSAMYQR